VICDVMLPEVDGYEVCRFVRAQPALARVPVLLISGVSSPEVEERAAAVGAAGVLAKPFTAESLMARIEGIVGPGPGGDPGRGGDPRIAEVLARARALPGVRAAYALDLETGDGRDAAGEAPPPGLLAMVRHAAGAAAELGVGDPYELFVEGAERTLVVHRIGRVAIAVSFDRPVRLGLARHLVRRLLRRAESLTSLPEGDRNGYHPR
jgi:CheY-like chemotaxis protein